MLKLMIRKNIAPSIARVLVLGLTAGYDGIRAVGRPNVVKEKVDGRLRAA